MDLIRSTLKLAKEQVQELKQRNDAILLELGLPVFHPSVHRHAHGMGGAEYHTVLKRQSWKLRLANTVDECMRYAGSRTKFISLMESEGYAVRWESSRKSFTFTTLDGMKWVTLNRLVLEDIRRNALEAHRHVQDYMDMLMSVKEERQKANVERCREPKKMDKRLDELAKILNKLYENVAQEEISEDRYQAMVPKYEREQIELRSSREELAAKIAKNDEVCNNIQQFIPLIWKYTNIQEGILER